MVVRTARLLAALLGLLAGCAAPALRPDADPGPIPFAPDPRPVTELAPAAAAQEALAPVLPGPPEKVELALGFPDDGTIFSDAAEAYVAGRLDTPFGVPGRVDAVIVIDTSDSTERDSRAGEDEDAVLRRVRGRPRAAEASILAAELASARLLLEDVDPRHTRLAVVSFAGADPDAADAGDASAAPNARTEVPLTRSLEALAAGLERLARRGAAGRTDMAAGLDRAVDELAGRGLSRPDPGALKVVIFFTDGTPTLPYRRTDANEHAVIRAAERAADHGVRVFSFAVGPEALGRPVATVEMARRTGGVFTPVRDPADLLAAVESVRFTNVDELEIRNATLDVGARRIHLGPDGGFDALVPLRSGKNRITIRAVVGDVAAEAERFVHYAPGSARPFVPAELERRRARLAAERQEREVEVEAGRNAAVLEAIDRDRRQLERRAARQLKELSIDVAAPPPEQ
jgi:hypothetical protein